MQHPFGGVLKSEQAATSSTVKPLNPTTSRRGLFGLFAGAVAAGTVGLVSGSKAQAQMVTTQALGEEGGRRVTTQMLGEEGGGQRVTTRALGEEGGRRPTTLAVGEEGGGRRPTTYMLGEEGGGRPPVWVRG